MELSAFRRKVEISIQKVDGKIEKAKAFKATCYTNGVGKSSEGRIRCGLRTAMHLGDLTLQGRSILGSGHRMLACLADALGLQWRPQRSDVPDFRTRWLEASIDGAGEVTSPRVSFLKAYEKGGVYTFDEVDRSDPVALLAVNPHLANGVATFPDKQIKRHKDCIIICTANTWGLAGDSNYSGATKLDAAFLSRFPIRLGWDIDPELEAKIVTNEVWLARVRGARNRARACGLKVLIDTRAAQAGELLINAGYSMDDAANMTYLANLKPEQRKQVEGTI